MSTGEVINANGAILSQAMVRAGFHRFPQSVIAELNPELWAQVAPLEIASDYPFKARKSTVVPPGEVWFVDGNKNLLGRIINLVRTDTKSVRTHDDDVDFIAEEENPAKTERQRERRLKDKLL